MSQNNRYFHPSVVAALVVFMGTLRCQAQIDPETRQLIQFGYNQPLKGEGPVSGYAFYYLNRPQFVHSNMTLRLALAPVYLDSELGFSKALGPQTDLAVGLAGGGFADTYSEVRMGDYLKSESFTGHGGEISGSVYHLFNPDSMIPLHGVLRSSLRYSTYSEDADTAPTFVVPDDRFSFNVRAGLRWGGREPVVLPPLSMELSIWYEGQFRSDHGSFGFNGDRSVEPDSHLFWARGMIAYTLPELKHQFNVSLTLGTSINPDRFSAYRLGAVLPLASEFPLNLPGYYYQEITAERYAILAAQYSLPLDKEARWSLTAFGSSAVVDYLQDFEQSGNFHSGVGGGIIFRSSNGAWQSMLGYAYGVNAIRDGDRGAHSIGILIQFDLQRLKSPLFDPFDNPYRWLGLDRLFGGS